MRLTVYLLALLAAHPFEWIAAGQVRGAGVMGFGGLLGHGDIGHHHENEELEDTGAKSTKKKDDTHKGTGNDYEESSEDGDALVDDEVPADDDGATDDVGGTPPDGDDTPTPPDGFQLRDLFFPCELIESQFELPVSCELDVVDALLSEGSVGITVDLNDRVCTPSILNRNACVSPIYSAYFGIFNLAISSRVDFTNITVGEFALGDVGLELEACGTDSETDNFFCSCEASFNGNACASCEICGFGNGNPITGVSFDCTNLVPLLSSFNSCQEVAAIQSLQADKIPVSVPNFIKELEFR
ncbi:hypothetical protein FisN_2Lh270 [Fistulifera solaris]|uniref:Uncharacterized protein n=1 Tax=Fistulifera solaris TaxID=1519565 RepID=A0A1Z5KFY8_FISSO|nr:hypothetical protein FisN_2Lh270 [Fistulifera solaris]|eukprot:GAX24991.1 hypothetical protein FisN_2Lh270 [Fistulifera solaris]